MRLIDADKFAIEEPKLWDWDSVDDISSTAVLKQCIWDVQCAPKVETIPIEWIREVWLKREENIGDIETYCPTPTFTVVMEWLIKDWEKENGQETTN